MGIALIILIVSGVGLAIQGYKGYLNKPPVIDSVIMPFGGESSVGVPTTLGVEARDPDGDVLSYTWSCEEDPSINSRTENEFEWTPGTYHITITITDGINDPVSRSILVITGTTHAPPQADISAPASIKAGSRIQRRRIHRP